MKYIRGVLFGVIFVMNLLFAQQGGNSRQFSGTNNDRSTLSVELTFFSASLNWNSVKLDWQTATETNNYGFDVERSLVNSQQSLAEWKKIGFVQGTSNSNSSKNYSFVDENPPGGDLQYRLKQIDLDGTSKYFSSVAMVHNTFTEVNEKKFPTEFILQQNYPNPFNPVTVINYQLPVAGEVTLKMYDVLGNEVATLVNEYKAPGYYKVEFNANKLSAGVYIYQLKTNKFVSTKKLLLLK